MGFSELYAKLKKSLEYDKRSVKIENIPDDEKKKLVRLCESQDKVSVYQQNDEGNVLELGLYLKDEYPSDIIFPELKVLRIYKASITDTSFLSNYENLETLSLEECGLNEVPDLSNYAYLKDLAFFNNNIKTIEGIDHLTGLTDLSFAYNEISKITGLETLKNLETINLMANKFSKIEGLENLSKIRLLGLEENPNLKVIEGINQMKNAREIGLSYCAIEDINGLREFSGFNELNFLTLTRNMITEVEVKVMLPKLEELHLRDNKIRMVNINGNLPALKELDLKGNQISEIETISNLPNLRDLNLDENKFTILRNLYNLPSLTRVYINMTPVKEVRNIDLPKDCWINSFLIERFTEEEREGLEQTLKELGVRPYWLCERDYWD